LDHDGVGAAWAGGGQIRINLKPAFSQASLFISGGDVAKLGVIDGVDQWPSLRENNDESPRNETLLNIGDLNDIEAIIDGKFKLIRSTYIQGAYDGFYGEHGRGLPNPPYDSASVITSHVSKAIMALKINTSTKEYLTDKMKQLRAAATVSCEGSRRVYSGGPHCPQFCLFDVEQDPCETVNLASKYPDVTETLKKKLERFKSEMVPELTKDVDCASNPAFFNNTWVCWLDDENLKKVPKTDVNTTKCIATGGSAKISVPVYVSILCIVFTGLWGRFLKGFSTK
jgi:hypothetical protein